MAIGFYRSSGTDPHREAIGPLGSNCSTREVSTTHYEICSKLKNGVRTPLTEFSESAHGLIVDQHFEHSHFGGSDCMKLCR